ncbi:hypothetical protein [Paenibacillus wynnii]|uniref:hypothetical protein n=1 Tax=Paenibacillus wynnii TaxID=268407 RepID=UPI0027939352|nr:hypothetical protein [Paenibacillus wynnii]MDQ0196126.1 hypothetical protein [Paenibacillus wynnii]
MIKLCKRTAAALLATLLLGLLEGFAVHGTPMNVYVTAGIRIMQRSPTLMKH